MNQTYYPKTNDGRADWWQNILQHIAVVSTFGFDTGEIDSITADAQWGVYAYRTVREAYEEMFGSIIAYLDTILDGATGAPAPTPPAIPAWPTAPVGGPSVGVEERRVQWVGQIKTSPNYNASVGTLLKLEAASNPFDEATYKAILFGLTSPSAHTVSGKFRKAGGQIDGINLYGRKEGTMTWIMLGRFNATPFSALVPLAGAAPEPWEFLARAVKRDVEIGIASDVVQQIVRG